MGVWIRYQLRAHNLRNVVPGHLDQRVDSDRLDRACLSALVGRIGGAATDQQRGKQQCTARGSRRSTRDPPPLE